MQTADDICHFLTHHQIEFRRCDHPAVYTCAEAEALVPSMPGAKTKNLFLCDDKGRRHFLVVVPADKRVDLKALSPALGIKKLRFASANRLERHLGLTPGAVTLLAVVNDPDRVVTVVIDTAIWMAEALLCHPLVNTSTLSLPIKGIQQLLRVTGHRPEIVEVPQRTASS
ncbi:MAG: prolyl-tRNA synthetase associated domain-containing protein [Desulfosarcinaceae bacterium]|jgi:Ala-tRNA(Pro) deacylase